MPMICKKAQIIYKKQKQRPINMKKHQRKNKQIAIAQADSLSRRST
jgi:hypothetical protein